MTNAHSICTRTLANFQMEHAWQQAQTRQEISLKSSSIQSDLKSEKKEIEICKP